MRAACAASEPMYASVALSLSATGLHSMLSPRVSGRGLPVVVSAIQRWRRSMSPQFELKSTTLRCAAKDHCSTSQLPGVRTCGEPRPSAASEYRCCQPSCSLAITRRLLAAQLRTPPPVSPAMYGNESCREEPLCQISRDLPVATSATHAAP